MPERLDGIKLENNIVTITGPPDSGKSNLVKWLLRQPQYADHFIYDPLFGYDPDALNVIRPRSKKTKYRRYEHGNPELNQAVDEFILEEKPKVFAIDETGRLLPNNKPEGAAMGELNDFNAHYGISVWLIGQRHAQMNSDFTNKATHHFVLGYKGKNDRDRLRDLHADLPDAIDEAKRKYGQYAFAYTGPNNSLKVMRPLPEIGEKAGL